MMFTRNFGRTLTLSFPDTGETSNAPFKPRYCGGRKPAKFSAAKTVDWESKREDAAKLGGCGTSSTPTKNRVSFDCLGAAHKIRDWPE
jgi:hypothetical protein